jgi:hypothetical protein
LVEYCLALALTTLPEKSCFLDPVSKFVNANKAPEIIALEVFSMGNIVDYAQVLPKIATSCKTGDGRKERWIVNRHIDLAT